MSDYPRNMESIRRYRLWDATKKAMVQYRYYTIKDNAKIGALIETKRASVGVTIELFDNHTGKLIGQYTRRVNRIDFSDGDRNDKA